MFSWKHGHIANCGWLWSIKCLFLIFILQGTLSASAVYMNMERIPNVRQLNYHPYRLKAAVPLPRFAARTPRDENVPFRDISASKDIFYMGPSDAVSKTKWSQPAVEHPHPGFFSRHEKEKIQSPRNDYYAFSSYPSYIENHGFQTPLTKAYSEEDLDAHLVKSPVNSVLKHLDKIEVYPAETVTTEGASDHWPPTSKPQLHLSRNNFTDSNDSHILIPSNSVFDYQSSAMLSDEASERVPSSQDNDSAESAEVDISSNISPQTTLPPIHDHVALEKDNGLRKQLSSTVSPESFETTTISYHFSSTHDFVNKADDFVTNVPPAGNTDQFPDALPSVESTTSIRLNSGAVAGIVIAVLVCVTVITSAVIYLLYRRYNGKCTNVVEGKFNSDNCGYLDDSLRSSVYLNNHIELPKENSEEMSSLDNDSFLNSLETMTIQNYWADNTKNTKV